VLRLLSRQRAGRVPVWHCSDLRRCSHRLSKPTGACSLCFGME